MMELCGVRTENWPAGFKTGEQISPPGGYVGGVMQLQTDLAIDPAGNVWMMNNSGRTSIPVSARLLNRSQPAAAIRASPSSRLTLSVPSVILATCSTPWSRRARLKV
jgi:hypothetical protein